MKRKGEFLDVLKHEIVSRRAYLQGEKVETVYFGGGTPSLLKVEELETILKNLHDHFEIDPEAEITLEANPDTLSLDYLVGLRSMGVNRLSIGIQSFFDNDLTYLSRRHDSRHARQCVGWAREAGFDNITIDLIYGLPTSDAEQWSRNLDCFFELGLPHLSAYALTLEPNSILTKQIDLGKTSPVTDEDAVRDYGILCQKMAQQGFQHYEISNFCKPGMHSRHNASYWFGTPYAGFGPSAHSYDGKSRQWNVSSLEQYVGNGERNPEGLTDRKGGKTENGKLFEKEILTLEQRYDEYVMLRLRTMWGIDLKYLKSAMGERFSEHCERQAQPLIAQGRLSQRQGILFLNDEQMLFADGIAEELFW